MGLADRPSVASGQLRLPVEQTLYHATELVVKSVTVTLDKPKQVTHVRAKINEAFGD